MKEIKAPKGYYLANGYNPKDVKDMYWFSGPKQISKEITCHRENACQVKVYWSSEKKWLFNISVVQEAFTLQRTTFSSIPLDKLGPNQKAELKLYGPVSGKVTFNQIFRGIKAEYQIIVLFSRPSVSDKKVITHLEPIYIDHSVPDGIFGFEDV
ncbi:hypothetical protein DSO57_1027613 [Entomophthora muscae]|uniref:Uncharacterized protein n=1 Tax=Entomophthora muscae TaxID=34485 RepID=A0ACC2S3R5_9FUNG|nr:hypothetical protein DSO57_1027613 [Entomophthora muscae]